jgi:hypothetical protein
MRAAAMPGLITQQWRNFFWLLPFQPGKMPA